MNEKMNQLYAESPGLFPEEDCSIGELLSRFQSDFEGETLEKYLDENISAVLKMVFVGRASEMSAQMMLSRNFKGVKHQPPFELA